MKRPRLGIEGRNVVIKFALGPILPLGDKFALVEHSHKMSPRRARELAGQLATLALAAENACNGGGTSTKPTGER